MKNIVVFFMLVLGLMVQVNAQNEAEILRELFQLEKMEIVKAYMDIDESKADAFWAIYADYEADRSEVSMTRFDILQRYADQYESLTNEQADALMKDVFANNKKSLAIQKKYYNKIKKELGAKEATAFWQLEDYLRTAIRFAILDAIPFVSKE